MASKYNVRVQYSAWIAVVTLGTVMVMTGADLLRTIESQEATTRRRARTAARTIAQSVARTLASTNSNAAASIVPGIVSTVVADEEALYVRVLDRGDHRVYPTGPDHRPEGLLFVIEPIALGTNGLGTVEVGMGQATMSKVIMGAVLTDLGLGAVLLIVFVGTSIWASAPVRGALRELLGFVKRVAAGESRGEQLDSDLAEVDEVGQALRDLVTRVEDAQVRLTKAQKELKVAQKEMDEYTYVISHDLKEPLRGIAAFSQFLADGYRDKLDEDGRHHIDVIRNSALRMQRLINDLLKFSRLSQQKNPMTPVGLNSMLIHVRLNLQYALDAKKVDLRVDRLPTVVCDATAMTEVFHNLISNAIKYNDKPQPVIEVGSRETVSPTTNQVEYEFFVRDNGLGIKKEYFEKIFQIFQRLQRDEEGTGIGLTIVKRVVEWHGGRVWLESEEGTGTTFYFTLPKREVTKTGTIMEAPRTPAKGGGQLAPTL